MQDGVNIYRVMLTNALKALVNNLVKESFYGEKNKTINILTDFFISHKSYVKTFIKWIIKNYVKGSRYQWSKYKIGVIFKENY